MKRRIEMETNDITATGDFKPPKGHPRVFFTSKDIPRILSNMSKEQNACALADHEQNLKDDTDGKLERTFMRTNYNGHILSVVESRAFEYAIRGNETAGRSAISTLYNFCDGVIFTVGDWVNNSRTVSTIALVYDWCFPLLSEDDKVKLHDLAIAIASTMEMGWPPLKQGSVVGHGVENQMMRDLPCLALAVYDEYPDIYESVIGRFFKEVVEPKRFMYKAHSHNQGEWYFGRFHAEIMAVLIMDAVGKPRIFGDDQQYVPYWLLYARRPDGLFLVDGDTCQHNYPRHRRTFVGPLLHAGNYFNDEYLKGEALKELGDERFDPLEQLIFNNPDLKGKPVDSLPLTMYYPPPKGAMIARTSWEEGLDSPAVVAEMKINEWWFSNHQHLDAGGFQIYYKGALATDTGYYGAAKSIHGYGGTYMFTPNDGSSGYSSTHDFNYNKRTIGHNCMLVYDPSEEVIRANCPPVINDGGQRMPNGAREPFDFQVLMDPANKYKTGDVLGHEIGKDTKAPNYTYLKGDLTLAYSQKVKSYQRSFMFFNLKDKTHPAVLVVFDRIESSKAELRKTWMLHGVYEPSVAVKGAVSRSVFINARNGYNGKLTVDTLLPAADNCIIEKVGGPGKEFWVTDDNYYAIPREGGINEGGGWRIDVSPGKAETLNYFLNVLQPTDASPQIVPLDAVLIKSSTHIGIAIADRIVLFGLDTARTKTKVSFSFNGPGEAEITIADLEAGEWEISGPESGSVQVTAEGGIAVFTGKPGAYTFTRLA
jgi:hypothetical protein